MFIYNTNKPTIIESSSTDLYQYRCYIGNQEIQTNSLSSYWYVTKETVGCFTGNNKIFTDFLLCVEILGYTPEARTSTYSRGTDLPYINGCSSKQLIHPNRQGDPTWQLLDIAANCKEQEHHIHSTARVVYVAKGHGKSIIGSSNNYKEYELKEGTVLILPKMVQHHFEATAEGLVVVPLHIFSSSSSEFNHPMFNGTHIV